MGLLRVAGLMGVIGGAMPLAPSLAVVERSEVLLILFACTYLFSEFAAPFLVRMRLVCCR